MLISCASIHCGLLDELLGPPAVLRDLNVPLSEIPAEAYASLLAENVRLGTNSIGQPPAEALAGGWTGASKSNEIGSVSTVDLVFNGQGNLTDYFQRGLGVLTVDMNFVTQAVNTFAVGVEGIGELRPVASTVEAKADGSLVVSIVDVQDLDLPTGRSRFQETATATLTLDDSAGTLTGPATIVTEVINSAVPGTEIGEVLRSSFELSLVRTDLPPGLARRAVGDFNRDLASFDEATIRSFVPTGLQLGVNLTGPGDRSFLTGLWSGKLNFSDLLTLAISIEFDSSGNFTKLIWDPPIPNGLDFMSRVQTQKQFENGDAYVDLPLASNVTADDASSFFIESYWMTDGTLSTGQRSRTAAGIMIDATPDRANDTLTVAASAGGDLIASQVPGAAPGLTGFDLGESALDRIFPLFVDDQATASVSDLTKPINEFDDATLAMLIPADLPIGASVVGSDSLSVLAGIWTGVERREGEDAGRSVELTLDADGVLTDVGDSNFTERGIVSSTIDLETRSVKPLSSRVQTDDGVKFVLVSIVLVESTISLPEDVIQRRTIESTIRTLQLEGDRLSGRSVTTIASPAPLEPLFSTTWYESGRYSSNLERK
jgi:hypothetical protein